MVSHSWCRKQMPEHATANHLQFFLSIATFSTPNALFFKNATRGLAEIKESKT